MSYQYKQKKYYKRQDEDKDNLEIIFMGPLVIISLIILVVKIIIPILKVITLTALMPFMIAYSYLVK